jgi:hypothetical protein
MYGKVSIRDRVATDNYGLTKNSPRRPRQPVRSPANRREYGPDQAGTCQNGHEPRQKEIAMFTVDRVTTFAVSTLLTTGLALGAFASAATAAAAPIDAQTVCANLSAGQPLMALGAQIHQSTDWSPQQAAAFVVQAVDTNCPENHYRLLP